MTLEIVDAMALRDFIENTKTKRDKEYKTQTNKVTAMQEKAKQNYFNSLIEKENSITTLWRAMNEILDKGKKSTQQGNIQITPKTFNDHFYFSNLQPGNRAFGEINCPNAQESDQGAYSCEAINSKGSCFAGSTGCGQPGQVMIF